MTQKFSLGEAVTLAMSGEVGKLIGIASYLEQPDSYFVRYVTATGHQEEAWFAAGALRAHEALDAAGTAPASDTPTDDDDASTSEDEDAREFAQGFARALLAPAQAAPVIHLHIHGAQPTSVA